MFNLRDGMCTNGGHMPRYQRAYCTAEGVLVGGLLVWLQLEVRSLIGEVCVGG